MGQHITTIARPETWPTIGIIATDDDGHHRVLEARMSDHACYPCYAAGLGADVDHRDGSACVAVVEPGPF